ncbi:hypothetical protein BOSEA31B_30039 [Hyphomicrobiales bacterium]|nr:hypothetical protein BOSEA31B_30039 [Hyphomicrobiales bacterium]CAH1703061.1 hypothetical protein BOSEA1005_40049 [Hyphomicrobiales bacterium]
MWAALCAALCGLTAHKYQPHYCIISQIN